MNEIDMRAYISQAVNAETYKLVLSNPRPQSTDCTRIVINKIGEKYQAESYRGKQVFHENMEKEALIGFVCEKFGDVFRQLNAWDEKREYSLRLTKRDKPLFSTRPNESSTAPAKRSTHNREKNYLLPEGTVIPPLVDMGVFTGEGRVVSSMYDKYRQINRFLELLDHEVDRMNDKDTLRMIDFGCGKSYLTFIIYYYFKFIKKINVQMIGLDLKADVIKNCNKAAERYGWNDIKFELGDINGYKPEFDVDIVLTLHACDTATDHALKNAVDWGARLIMSVPCCQHELNAQIRTDDLSALTRYGLIRERFSALLTDAIRANLLIYSGYSTDVLEFVDMAHTPKNVLIRARKTNIDAKTKKIALKEAESAMQGFNVSPTLYRLVVGDGCGR